MANSGSPFVLLIHHTLGLPSLIGRTKSSSGTLCSLVFHTPLLTGTVISNIILITLGPLPCPASSIKKKGEKYTWWSWRDNSEVKSCSCLLSIALINTIIKSNLRREALFGLQITVDLKGNQGRNQETENKAATTKNIAYCLSQLPSLYNWGPPTQGWHHSQ